MADPSVDQENVAIAPAGEEHKCSGCSKDFVGNLSCPTCIKLNLPACYFCSQECFKGNWVTHKAVHQIAKLKKDEEEYLKLFKSYKFSGELRPAGISPWRKVPAHIKRPDYAEHGIPVGEENARGHSIAILKPEQIERLRECCKIAREALDVAHRLVRPGITTDEIDEKVHEYIVSRDGYPSPLNYHNFPKSCCTSVNEVICHGIPDRRPLVEGDIVNVDVTVYYKGMHGDLNETYFVGEVKEDSKQLVKGAYHCLMAAIAMCKPGVMYRELGNTIEKLARGYKLSVTRSYCGHGVHELFHTAPNVPHYARNKAVGEMKAGHAFTIEPMINIGTSRDQTWPDNWTAVTADGARSAQFEHTLLVTETGVEILTARLPTSPPHDFEVPEGYQ
eukprot:GDKH01007260.1.p1 GENE.GDKH01007260.1~~GDKH01007260.1.p1  ORF type:complete len:390 (-),score=100.93 GDKH01007260.1:164-1333(-)